MQLMQFVDKNKVESISHRYDKDVELLKPIGYDFSVNDIVTPEKKIRKPYDRYEEFSNWLSEKVVADFEVD